MPLCPCACLNVGNKLVQVLNLTKSYKAKLDNNWTTFMDGS